jgi:hypothetical protein
MRLSKVDFPEPRSCVVSPAAASSLSSGAKQRQHGNHMVGIRRMPDAKGNSDQ